jgi:hypothetical protein
MIFHEDRCESLVQYLPRVVPRLKLILLFPFPIDSWKMKKLIKNLDAARGNGTSMISLVMKPGVRS